MSQRATFEDQNLGKDGNRLGKVVSTKVNLASNAIAGTIAGFTSSVVDFVVAELRTLGVELILCLHVAGHPSIRCCKDKVSGKELIESVLWCSLKSLQGYPGTRWSH